MSYESANEFLEKMKQDKDFRAKAASNSKQHDFDEFIKKNGYSFEENHLAAAMANCMDDMEKGSS